MKELIQRTLNMSQAERVNLANRSCARIMNWASAHGYDEAALVMDYFKLFVSGDLNCDYRERDLFNKTFEMNVDADTFYGITNHGANNDFVAKMTRTTASMDSDTRSCVAILGLAVMCADGTMTADEQKLLYKVCDL